MQRVLLGFALGMVFGVTATAWAAGIFGDDSYLLGWTVTKDGETVCESPYVWTGTHELECD